MGKEENAYVLHLGRDTVYLRISDKMMDSTHIWNSKRHCNADYELHFLLQGLCHLDVEQERYTLQAPQAILIAPGRYHQPFQQAGPFERLSVSFSLEEGPLSQAMAAYVATAVPLPISRDLVTICREIIYEYVAANDYRQEMAHALVTQLLIVSLRQLALPVAPAASSSIQKGSQRTDLIDYFFEVHYADKAGEEQLAQMLHLSRRQLSRVLQTNYGMNYRQKLLCARMDRAAHLLRTTQEPISRIADAVGYSSEAAFYQAFRSYFGTSPQQHRQALHRGSQEQEG